MQIESQWKQWIILPGNDKDMHLKYFIETFDVIILNIARDIQKMIQPKKKVKTV